MYGEPFLNAICVARNRTEPVAPRDIKPRNILVAGRGVAKLAGLWHYWVQPIRVTAVTSRFTLDATLSRIARVNPEVTMAVALDVTSPEGIR